MPSTATNERDALQEAIARVASKRADAIRAQQDATRELADLAVQARGIVPIAEFARRADLTRKAVYDLIAWRTGEKSARH